MKALSHALSELYAAIGGTPNGRLVVQAIAAADKVAQDVVVLTSERDALLVERRELQERIMRAEFVHRPTVFHDAQAGGLQ